MKSERVNQADRNILGERATLLERNMNVERVIRSERTLFRERAKLLDRTL